MTTFKRSLILIMIILAVKWISQAWVSSATAATQGSKGTTSTATSVLTVTIPGQFMISGLSDFALGTYSGKGSLSSNEDICVYTNGTGSYHVVATDSSSMSSTNFVVQNSTATASIPFTASWNTKTGTSGNSPLTYNTAYAGSGANTQATDCSIGGLSADIQISFASKDLSSAPGGTYSTMLTVMIEP